MLQNNPLASQTIITVDPGQTTAKKIEDAGYHVKLFSDAFKALQDNSSDSIKGVILDIKACSVHKGNLISEFRQKWPFAPLIAITDEEDLEQTADALSSGACDYINRSKIESELISRLESRVLESQKREEQVYFSLGDITVDVKKRLVTCGSKQKHISPTEVSLIQCLAASNGIIVDRELIKKRCWRQTDVTDNALNRKLHEVRRILADLSERVTIKTIYGSGFLLEIENQEERFVTP
ncbi:MAG: winged helix-turn-helix domain-containing protein [Bdellovibrionota bacterium]